MHCHCLKHCKRPTPYFVPLFYAWAKNTDIFSISLHTSIVKKLHKGLPGEQPVGRAPSSRYGSLPVQCAHIALFISICYVYIRFVFLIFHLASFQNRICGGNNSVTVPWNGTYVLLDRINSMIAGPPHVLPFSFPFFTSTSLNKRT